MGRSQRHKVMEQAIASNAELYASGVGLIPAATTHEMGLPRDAGVPVDVPLPPVGREVGASPFAEVTVENSPLVYGARGGPLGGSLVQGPGSEGGTAPVPPEEGGGGGPGPEPTAPTITSLDPDTVEVNTAIDVTITGTGFDAASTVMANGVEVMSDLVSDTELTVHLPSFIQAGVLTISVVNSGLPSNEVDFTVTEAMAAPVIDTIDPVSAPVDTPTDVALNGSGFTEATTVTMNGNPILFSYLNALVMIAHVPGISEASAVALAAVNGSSASNELNFIITAATRRLTKEDARR